MAKTSGSIRGNKHPKEISLDEYLGKRGLQSPISDFTDDKWRNIRLTARGRKKFEREADVARNEYHKRRNNAIAEYENLVKAGKIKRPRSTTMEALLSAARGHPDNQSVQAARRLLKKRYNITIK